MNQTRGKIKKTCRRPPGGRTHQIFYTGRLRPEVRISSIDKWHPFHIPCLELCIPFKCTVIQESITKMERFLDVINLLALLDLSQTQMTDYPTLSYTSTSKIPTLSYT